MWSREITERNYVFLKLIITETPTIPMPKLTGKHAASPSMLNTMWRVWESHVLSPINPLY